MIGSHNLLAVNLKDLGEEYNGLCEQENQLESLLERLQDEESRLQDALAIAEQASAIRKSPIRSRQEQERQAIKKLEEALMGDSSSDDGEIKQSMTENFKR
jgi:peptidoglycan hydrolase CwlO-like protein